MRKSRLLGSVRAKAKWLSYSTTTRQLYVAGAAEGERLAMKKLLPAKLTDSVIVM